MMCLSVIVPKGLFEKKDYHQSLIKQVNLLNNDFKKMINEIYSA